MNSREQFLDADDVLAMRGAAGDEASIVELYWRYRPRIVGFVLKRTGDRELARDIFCATFAAFLETLPTYRPCGKLPALLLRIARNRVIDELRRRGRLSEPDDEHRLDRLAATVDANPYPDEICEARETAELLQKCLGRLPEHLREVVILRLWENLDYAEIGRIVGIGETTARSRMRYALQRLREELKLIHYAEAPQGQCTRL